MRYILLLMVSSIVWYQSAFGMENIRCILYHAEYNNNKPQTGNVSEPYLPAPADKSKNWYCRVSEESFTIFMYDGQQTELVHLATGPGMGIYGLRKQNGEICLDAKWVSLFHKIKKHHRERGGVWRARKNQGYTEGDVVSGN
jgi:hypothetical protein